MIIRCSNLTDIFLPIFFLSLFSNVALSEITRHCDSYYELQYLSVNGDSFQNGKKVSFGNFKSSGNCGNAVPNRCRERARKHAQSCMDDHWRARWDRNRPESCTNTNGVKEYDIQDIKQEIKIMTCCSQEAPTNAQTHGEEVVVSLSGITKGNTKCAGKLNFSNTYTVDCTKRDIFFDGCR